jgi:hypothetical protein
MWTAGWRVIVEGWDAVMLEGVLQKTCFRAETQRRRELQMNKGVFNYNTQLVFLCIFEVCSYLRLGVRHFFVLSFSAPLRLCARKNLF